MQKTAIAARAQLHFSKSFFLRNALVSVSYDYRYLVIFRYTGEADWIIHLNVQSKDNFGMVNSERQFFLNPKHHRQILLCYKLTFKQLQ